MEKSVKKGQKLRKKLSNLGQFQDKNHLKKFTKAKIQKSILKIINKDKKIDIRTK